MTLPKSHRAAGRQFFLRYMIEIMAAIKKPADTESSPPATPRAPPMDSYSERKNSIMTKLVPASCLALAMMFSASALVIPALADGGVEFVLRSTIRVDPVKETVTLPLFRGMFNGSPVYYIVTESSDQKDADKRQVNYASKLRNALGTGAVQKVTDVGGLVTFIGTVAFASSHNLRPGPDGIPPGIAPNPQFSRGDANYSPLITTGNGIVLNASQVANASGVHDSLVSIDFTQVPAGVPGAAGEVTLSTFLGSGTGAPIMYLHMEGSREEISALEGSTFAPNLNFAPGVGSNEEDTSARSAIIPIRNGREARGDPERQGLNSFVHNQGDPLNVTQEFPQGGRYSPIWDVTIVDWTAAAIAAGERRRLVSPSDVVGEFNKGHLVGEGLGPPNPSLDGIRANDAISNCPIIIRLPGLDPGQRGTPQQNRR